MPYYLVQSAYTPEAWATLIKNPQDRNEAVRPAIERLGGRLHSAWFAFGEYDVVAIVEMLLGGDGSEPAPMPDRPLTRTELGLAQLVLEQLGHALEQAFAPVAPTNFVVGAASPHLSFDVLGRLTVPIVAAKFHLFAVGLGGASRS